MDEQKIKANLKRLRIEKGLSQESLSTEMNIGRNTYINMENGRTHMLNKRLYDAARVLGCSVENLLEDKGGGEENSTAYYAKHGGIEENFVHLRDEMEKMREENAGLRDEIGRLTEKISSLEDKNSSLEELYLLHKEISAFYKEKSSESKEQK